MMPAVSTVNPLAREISAKIVYYGPGLSGKTTSLQQIHASLRPETRGQLVSLSTEGDRTLFFDFLPVEIAHVRGLTLRLQLYTVPGQVFYDATRKLVLNGADGVVFVADSQEAARDTNDESIRTSRRTSPSSASRSPSSLTCSSTTSEICPARCPSRSCAPP